MSLDDARQGVLRLHSTMSLEVVDRLIARHGWGEEVTLDVSASELYKCITLFRCLPSFGDRLQVERLCKLHDRIDESPALIVVDYVVNESLIDLQDVDRE